MITMFKSRVRSRFRSRDAAWAAAWKLSLLLPGYDYEPWPDRGYWVLVMRYRDDDGHIRFKFAGTEDPLKRRIQEKTRALENVSSVSWPAQPPCF